MNKCNTENNYRIDLLNKENEVLIEQKDSILNLNINLVKDLVLYDTIISNKEKDIIDMNNSIIKKEREINKLKKEKYLLNKERKKILENKKKVNDEIKKLLSEIKNLSGEELIKSLKEKLK
tara:strand:+ start:494 stop:856 length:363 start_codon:yes stop_codon:yes gene_type:complete